MLDPRGVVAGSPHRSNAWEKVVRPALPSEVATQPYFGRALSEELARSHGVHESPGDLAVAALSWLLQRM